MSLEPKQIKQAYERLTPDAETKERMLEQILRKHQEAVAAPPEQKVVWYTRIRMPLGIATAAAACVALFVAAIGNPLLTNHGSSRQELLEQATDGRMHTADGAISTQPDALDRTASVGTTEPAVSGTSRITTVAVSTGTASSVTSASACVAQTTCVTTAPPSEPCTSSVVTTVAATAPQPVETTAATSWSTTAAITSAAVETTETSVVPVTTPPAVQTSATTTSCFMTFYGNMYDFAYPIWNVQTYSNGFEPIEELMVGDYLGSSAAYDATGENCHTILVYAIEGMDPETAIAVQYINSYQYYICFAE